MTGPSGGWPDLPPDYRDGLADTWQTLLGLSHAAFGTGDLVPALRRWLPLTLITGFLGAGKTTLINSLLREPAGRRLTVVVNDFGSLNIDAALLRASSSETLTLQNGCVCCTLANGLAATLDGIVRAPSPPDAVILEASGVAEPHGIVQLALANPALRLDGIVTLVDAETLPSRIGDPRIGPTIRRQVRAADLVLLNKVDLIDPAGLARSEALLRDHAPSVRILRTRDAAAPIDVVVGSAPGRSTFLAEVPDDHAAAYDSHLITLSVPLDERSLCDLAETLPEGVLRAKGLVVLDRDPCCRAVLQVVGRRWDLQPDSAATMGDGSSNIVVIGIRGSFDAAELKRRFLSCQNRPTVAGGGHRAPIGGMGTSFCPTIRTD